MLIGLILSDIIEMGWKRILLSVLITIAICVSVTSLCIVEFTSNPSWVQKHGVYTTTTGVVTKVNTETNDAAVAVGDEIEVIPLHGDQWAEINVGDKKQIMIYSGFFTSLYNFADLDANYYNIELVGFVIFIIFCGMFIWFLMMLAIAMY